MQVSCHCMPIRPAFVRSIPVPNCLMVAFGPRIQLWPESLDLRCCVLLPDAVIPLRVASRWCCVQWAMASFEPHHPTLSFQLPAMPSWGASSPPASVLCSPRASISQHVSLYLHLRLARPEVKRPENSAASG